MKKDHLRLHKIIVINSSLRKVSKYKKNIKTTKKLLSLCFNINIIRIYWNLNYCVVWRFGCSTNDDIRCNKGFLQYVATKRSIDWERKKKKTKHAAISSKN